MDGAHRSWCKACATAWAKEWRAKNPGKAAKAGKKWREAHPEEWARLRKQNRLRANYKIELDEYEALVEKQGRACAICGDRFEGDTYGKLRVDHDHVDGKVRGLLCSECNLALGKFRDDPNVLLSALAYLLGQVEPVEV